MIVGDRRDSPESAGVLGLGCRLSARPCRSGDRHHPADAHRIGHGLAILTVCTIWLLIAISLATAEESYQPEPTTIERRERLKQDVKQSTDDYEAVYCELYPEQNPEMC